MVINPIVGVYIPMIRIPIKRWDDHPQNNATFDHGTYASKYQDTLGVDVDRRSPQIFLVLELGFPNMKLGFVDVVGVNVSGSHRICLLSNLEFVTVSKLWRWFKNPWDWDFFKDELKLGKYTSRMDPFGS